MHVNGPAGRAAQKATQVILLCRHGGEKQTSSNRRDRLHKLCVDCRTKHLDQLESKNILVLRGILSLRENYSRSACREEIISKTRVILWWPFLRGKCVVNLRVILSFWEYFFVGVDTSFGWIEGGSVGKFRVRTFFFLPMASNFYKNKLPQNWRWCL